MENLVYLNEDYLRQQIRKNLIQSQPRHIVRISLNERVSSGASTAGKFSGITVGNCEIEIPKELDDLIKNFKGKSKQDIEHDLRIQYGLIKQDPKGVKGKDFINVKNEKLQAIINSKSTTQAQKTAAKNEMDALDAAISKNAERVQQISAENRKVAVDAIKKAASVLSTYLNITGMQSIVCVGISFVLKQMATFAVIMSKALGYYDQPDDPNPKYSYKTQEVNNSVGFRSSQYSIQNEIDEAAMKIIENKPFNNEQQLDVAYPTATLQNETTNIPLAVYLFPNFSKAYIKDPTKREEELMDELEKDKKEIEKDITDLNSIAERDVALVYTRSCDMLDLKVDSNKVNNYDKIPVSTEDEYLKMLTACKSGAILSYKMTIEKSIKLYLKLFENDSSDIGVRILNKFKEIEVSKNNLTIK